MTKDELNKVRDLNRRIELLTEKITKLRQLATRIVPVLDDLPQAKTLRSKVEIVMLNVLIFEDERNQKREELKRAKEDLADQIMDEVEDVSLQTMLIMRYVELMTWTNVAKVLGVSRRTVYRLNKIFVCHLAAH